MRFVTPLDVLIHAGYEVNTDEAYFEDGTPMLDRGYAYIIPPEGKTYTPREIAECLKKHMKKLEIDSGGWPDEYGYFSGTYGEAYDGELLGFMVGYASGFSDDVAINLYVA